MTGYIHLSGKKVEVVEKEEPVLLEIITKKVEVIKDELDISVEEEKKEEEPPKEAEPEEEGPPKFKPEGMSWTDCDGNPRNHVQVISKFTKYPIVECDTSLKNLENSLMEILYDVVKTKDGKIHLVNY